MFYHRINNTIDELHLRKGLNKLTDLSATLQMNTNVTNTKFVSFSSRQLAIQQCSYKYLGVTFFPDIKWNTHIENTINKANDTIGFSKINLFHA